MNVEKVFKRYDIRGEFPEEIDEEFSYLLGKAFATFCIENKKDQVVVSKDNRKCSEKAKESFLDGLREVGINIVDVDEGPTDRLAVATNKYGGFGVQVTASHLSWDMTGFKFVYTRGNGFNNNDLDRVKEIFQKREFKSFEQGFEIDETFEMDETYFERVIDYLKDSGILEEDYEYSNSFSDTKVVVDCGNGATQDLAPWIFQELGFNVVEVGKQELDPHPKEHNREFVRETVVNQGADIGIGFDPDGDRVYVILPDHGWVDGNSIIYCLSKLIGADKVAVSVDTADFVEEAGCEVFYSRVGDVFVSEAGVENNVDLLGEPNGHFALTKFSWYNSGIIAATAILTQLQDFKQVLKGSPENYTVTKSIDLGGKNSKKVFNKVMKHVAKNYDVLSTKDGVKFEKDGCTVLARTSGTSNVLRLVFNGEKEEDVEKVCENVYSTFSKFLI